MTIDTDEEIQKLGMLLIAGVVFLVSAVISWGELKYAIWGEYAEGTVTRTNQVQIPTRRGHKKMLRVEYHFTETDGTLRTESDDLPLTWKLEPEGKEQIQYFPGQPGKSRLQGHASTWAIVLFLGCLLWLSWEGFKLWREASDAVEGKPNWRK